MSKDKKRQRGMMLIEVVVAILIVGGAIAGGLAMVQAANRFGLSAEFNSIAQNKIQSIVDKIRINSFAKDEYVIDKNNINIKFSDFSSIYNEIKDKNNVLIQSKSSCTDSCNPAEIATLERAFWLEQLAQELPQGTGFIRRSNDANTYVAVVMWRANEEKSNDSASSSDAKTYGVTIPFSI